MFLICACGEKSTAPMIDELGGPNIDAVFLFASNGHGHICKRIILQCACGDSIETGPEIHANAEEAYDKDTVWMAAHQKHEGD